jgi:hypothetical protein
MKMVMSGNVVQVEAHGYQMATFFHFKIDLHYFN